MSFRGENLRSINGEYPETGSLGGRWHLAKPHPTLLRWRIRRAWLVLVGKAEIIVWGGQDDGE